MFMSSSPIWFGMVPALFENNREGIMWMLQSEISLSEGKPYGDGLRLHTYI